MGELQVDGAMDWIPKTIKEAGSAIAQSLPILEKHPAGFRRLIVLLGTIGLLGSVGTIAYHSKPMDFQGRKWQQDSPCLFKDGGLVCDR